MPRALVVVAALALALAVAGRVAIADEGDWSLALEPQLATLGTADGTAWGGGLAVDVGYGVSDALSLRLTGSASAHAAGATASLPSETAIAWFGGAGVTYTIDIVRLVPYLEFAVGLLGTTRAGTGCCDLGLQAGAGVDYLYTPKIAFGVTARYTFAVTSSDGNPTTLQVGPRLAIRF